MDFCQKGSRLASDSSAHWHRLATGHVNLFAFIKPRRRFKVRDARERESSPRRRGAIYAPEACEHASLIARAYHWSCRGIAVKLTTLARVTIARFRRTGRVSPEYHSATIRNGERSVTVQFNETRGKREDSGDETDRRSGVFARSFGIFGFGVSRIVPDERPSGEKGKCLQTLWAAKASRTFDSLFLFWWSSSS